jgi:O-Antigen ligase
LLRPSPLNGLSLALLLFVAYGVWQASRGVLAGSSAFHTLKFFVFNYYAIYLFMGIWVGLQAPSFLPKLIRVIGWVNGIYGVIWLIGLKQAEFVMPGSDVPLFGLPSGGVVAILGLLCFERNLRAVWPILALNIAVTLALQQRSLWLGLTIGICVWGLLTHRLGRAVFIGLVALAVLGMIELAGIKLGVGGRETSFAEVLARVIAPIDTELAEELSPNAEQHASSVEWRQKWWDSIWRSAHSTPMLEAFGHGYGFDLFSLAPPEVRAGQAEDIRTPHSVFYYALGYTGWVGVALFVAFQLTLLGLLWRSFRLSGQPAGVVFWFMGISMASFEVGFESPYKAIPFYLLVGMSIAPGLLASGDLNAHSARGQLLPAVAR